MFKNIMIGIFNPLSIILALLIYDDPMVIVYILLFVGFTILATAAAIACEGGGSGTGRGRTPPYYGKW